MLICFLHLLAIQRVSNVVPGNTPGALRKLNEEYFKRIDSIEFAVRYDDGKDPRGVLIADLVIIGISRTSKTPLSMYLANKNIRVANIPLVPEHRFQMNYSKFRLKNNRLNKHSRKVRKHKKGKTKIFRSS